MVMEKLLEQAFDDNLTPEEEAVLDVLEKEWLAMCRANSLEDFDWWEIAPANVPLVNPTSLN
jgi:hypothetical protein